MSRRFHFVRALTLGIAVVSPVASHAALALGQGYGAALGFAAAQGVAAGLLLRSALPRARWAGFLLSAVLLSALLLSALAIGARHSAAVALLVSAGVSHAVLYAGLLAVFAATLRPGAESLVTGLARRLNPAFHPGMVPYTRAVTAAWCLFFAGQLAASVLLLATAPGAWVLLVTTVHAPLVVLMALAEFLVRRWRWRHEHYTGFRDTIRGVRRFTAPRAAAAAGPAAAARTSSPGAGCPGHSGNAKPRPGPA